MVAIDVPEAWLPEDALYVILTSSDALRVGHAARRPAGTDDVPNSATRQCGRTPPPRCGRSDATRLATASVTPQGVAVYLAAATWCRQSLLLLPGGGSAPVARLSSSEHPSASVGAARNTATSPRTPCPADGCRKHLANQSRESSPDSSCLLRAAPFSSVADSRSTRTTRASGSARPRQHPPPMLRLQDLKRAQWSILGAGQARGSRLR
jgi:hypothetical protein